MNLTVKEHDHFQMELEPQLETRVFPNDGAGAWQQRVDVIVHLLDGESWSYDVAGKW